jgi:hypothetical protein
MHVHLSLTLCLSLSLTADSTPALSVPHSVSQSVSMRDYYINVSKLVAVSTKLSSMERTSLPTAANFETILILMEIVIVQCLEHFASFL